MRTHEKGLSALLLSLIPTWIIGALHCINRLTKARRLMQCTDFAISVYCIKKTCYLQRKNKPT